MATSLPFVGTIESDEEIEALDEENDSEDEDKVRTHTYQSIFVLFY
jgi:hypothetical protein